MQLATGSLGAPRWTLRELSASRRTTTSSRDEAVVEGPCALCRRIGPLRWSHLASAGLYRLARDESRKNPNPVVLAGGRASATSHQVAGYFLEGDCERRFDEGGENYVLAQCARPSGEFKLRELLERATPIEAISSFRVYDVGAILGAHMDKYLYFAASVFWRTSAWIWREGHAIKLETLRLEVP